MIDRADSEEAGVFRRLADFGRYVIGDTYSAANEGLKRPGRSPTSPTERGSEPFDTLARDRARRRAAHGAVADRRPTTTPRPGRMRKEVWDDDRAMLGGSDAGAHLDRMCGAPVHDRFIGDCLRGRKLVPARARRADAHRRAGAAVRPARPRPDRRGLPRRHRRVRPGDDRLRARHAGARPARWHARLTAGATASCGCSSTGSRRSPTAQPTGALPGTVLRSGRDTDTVVTG